MVRIQGSFRHTRDSAFSDGAAQLAAQVTPASLARRGLDPGHREGYVRRVDQSISFVTISTADLNAARAFYVDGLGWTPTLDVADEIIFFQIGPGMILGLYDAARFAADISSETPTVNVPSGLTVSLNVGSDEEVAQILATAARLGGSILKPAQMAAEFDGFHGHFADPNGLVWEIAHNPTWHVDERGVVTFG